MSSSLESRLLRGAAASVLFTIVSRTAALVVVPIALTGLGSELYGVWVISTVVASSQGLIGIGAGAAVTRFAAAASSRADTHSVKQVLKLAGMIYGALCLAVLMSTPFVVRDATGWLDVGVANEDEAVLLLWSGTVSFVLASAQALALSLLLGLQRTAMAYIASTWAYAPYVAVAAIGSATDHAVLGMALAGPVLFLGQLAGLAPTARRALRGLAPSPRAQRVEAGQILRFGGLMQLATVGDFAALQLPRLLGGLLFGASQITTVDIALRVGSFLAGMVLMTLPPLLPALTSAWERGSAAEYSRLGAEAARALVLLAAGLGLFVAVSAEPALTLWLGADRVDGTLVTTVVAVGAAMIVHALTGPFTATAQARGDAREIAAFKLCVVALFVALAFALSTFGPDGLAYSTTVALVVPSIGFLMLEARRWEGPVRRAVPALASFATLSGAAVVARVFEFAVDPVPAIGLGFSLTAFGAAVGVLVLMDREPVLRALRATCARRSAERR